MISNDDYNFSNDTSTMDFKLNEQLCTVRRDKHLHYLETVKDVENLNVSSDSNKINISRDDNKVKPWVANTTLIAGDSTVSGIIENRISTKDYPIKVRAFPGSTVNDFYHYLVPLLPKEPSNLILMCGTNDTMNKTPEEIRDDILKLKGFIKSELPNCNVIISFPTIRDDRKEARRKIEILRAYLAELNCESISNNNVTLDCLGKGRLHLNGKGLGRLAMNFKSYIRCL